MSARSVQADDTPGIYLQKVGVGWRFRVVFEFAGTTSIWRPIHRAALRAAERIARDEG